MKYEKRIVLFTLFAMNLVDQPAPEVKIEQGILSGIISTDGSYFEYIGIPYATTNSSTRFKAPLPPPSWTGVYQATRHYVCPQPTIYYGIKGTEDCLKVNIYVPAMARRPLPVMVWIHGGAFFIGSGGKLLYGPDFLVKQDVILVTFNYRLGILGFTCLGIEDAPGNAGLKDQVAALRWIKKNIAAFGGNLDNITIFGNSAGGTSVSILFASNVTEDLFHKAIMQSGSSVANWSINREPIFTASLIAKELGYNTSDPKEIFNIFSNLPYEELIAPNPTRPLAKYLDTELLNLPCIEKKFAGNEAILLDLPYNMINSYVRNIPLMYGSTNNEGLLIESVDMNEILNKVNKKHVFVTDLEFPSEDEAVKIDKEARKYYFENENMTMEVIKNVSRLMKDLYFEVPILLEAEIMVKKVDRVFNYIFNYNGGRNLYKFITGNKNKDGACHGDELLYLFKGNIWPMPIDRKDKRIIDVMTRMWTNFAKYGNPTPEEDDLPVKWLPSTRDGLKELYIDKDFQMGPIPNQVTYQFWKHIYENYRTTKKNV